MALAPFTRPTPTTAPTIADEVDTGIPIIEKRCIPNAAEIWAIKAAGLWGTGLGMGHPEFFPSEVQHDFIFTLITHEMGLMGGLLVIMTYVLLCLQGIRISGSRRFGKYVSVQTRL